MAAIAGKAAADHMQALESAVIPRATPDVPPPQTKRAKTEEGEREKQTKSKASAGM